MDRCEEAKKFQRIDDAFRNGDLDALRAAVDDPASIPNGRMADTIGPCLVYAIYHSPLPFIRTLLEIGADPNAPVDDGFPPLVAALCCGRKRQGRSGARMSPRSPPAALVRHGPESTRHQRLHGAPHGRRRRQRRGGARILLDGGADPQLRTRIDDYETPLDMAESAGLKDIAAMLRQP